MFLSQFLNFVVTLSLSNYNEMIFPTKILTISLFTLAYRGGRSIFGSNKSPDPTVSESLSKAWNGTSIEEFLNAMLRGHFPRQNLSDRHLVQSVKTNLLDLVSPLIISFSACRDFHKSRNQWINALTISSKNVNTTFQRE